MVLVLVMLGMILQRILLASLKGEKGTVPFTGKNPHRPSESVDNEIGTDTTDPHRAKPNNRLPTEERAREAAIQREITNNRPLNHLEEYYVLKAIREAAQLASRDPALVGAFKTMKAIANRAGPMPNLYGVIRNSILHLDQPLLNPTHRRELLITLLHEAGVLLGRSDEENERFPHGVCSY